MKSTFEMAKQEFYWRLFKYSAYTEPEKLNTEKKDKIVRAKNSSRITRKSNYVVWLCDENYLTMSRRFFVEIDI